MSTLAKTTKEGKTIDEYMRSIKVIANDLALIGFPSDEDEIIIAILNNLGDEYKEINAAIRARDAPKSFEELYDKLSDHERFLNQEKPKKEKAIITAQYNKKSSNKNKGGNNGGYPNQKGQANKGQHQNYKNFANNKPYQGGFNPNWHPPYNNQPKVVCQLCNKICQSAKMCKSRPQPLYKLQANFMTNGSSSNNRSWVMDSGVSHHFIFDLQNLSMHLEYGGTDNTIIGDGNGIPISHVGCK